MAVQRGSPLAPRKLLTPKVYQEAAESGAYAVCMPGTQLETPGNRAGYGHTPEAFFPPMPRLNTAIRGTHRGGYVPNYYTPRLPPRPNRERYAKIRAPSVSTWTVQVGEVPISYVSHQRWRDQPRTERGAAPETVGEPFRGCTLEDRHPHEPKATYNEEELQSLCPTCGTLVIHWGTHTTGKLHQARLAASGSALPVGPTQSDVAAALRVLQATRPDIIAASVTAASSDLLVSPCPLPSSERTPTKGLVHRSRGESYASERPRHRSRWDMPHRNGIQDKHDQGYGTASM